MVFSAFSIEAFLNELIETIVEGGTDSLHQFARTRRILQAAGADERASVLRKLKLLAAGLSDSEIDSNALPLADLGLLLDLRNTLAHARPEQLDFDERDVAKRASKLQRSLAARGLVRLDDGVYQTLWGDLQSGPVARWACTTAFDTMLFTAEMLPAGNSRDRLVSQLHIYKEHSTRP